MSYTNVYTLIIFSSLIISFTKTSSSRHKFFTCTRLNKKNRKRNIMWKIKSILCTQTLLPLPPIPDDILLPPPGAIFPKHKYFFFKIITHKYLLTYFISNTCSTTWSRWILLEGKINVLINFFLKKKTWIYQNLLQMVNFETLSVQLHEHDVMNLDLMLLLILLFYIVNLFY